MLAPLLLVLVALLGSCSSGPSLAEEPAAAVLEQTRAAAREAGSARVVGSLLQDGQEVALELRATTGAGGRGSVTSAGSRLEFVDDGTRLFLRGDEAFWAGLGGGELTAAFADRWLALSDTEAEQFADFRRLADVDALVQDVFQPSVELRNDGATEVDGDAAVVLRSVAQDGRALFVAAADVPLPLRVTGAEGAGSVDFDAWGEPVDTSAPDDAVDLSTLRDGGAAPAG